MPGAHFRPSSLLMESSRGRLKNVVPCHPHGRPGWSSGSYLLPCAWSSPCCCCCHRGVKRWMKDLFAVSRSLPPRPAFKRNLFKKRSLELSFIFLVYLFHYKLPRLVKIMARLNWWHTQGPHQGPLNSQPSGQEAGVFATRSTASDPLLRVSCSSGYSSGHSV